MSEKKVVAGLSLRADEFKQELDDVIAIEKRASEEGEAFALSFSEGFSRIEERSHKMAATLTNNGTVTKKTFDETLNILAKLEAAAAAGGKSIADAPEPIRKAFEVANQQLTAVAAQMQVNAANTEVMRARFMAAGAEAANLATHMSKAAEQQKAAAQEAQEVAEKFGDIPEKIDEIKKAGDRTYDEQLDDLKELAKQLEKAEKAYAKMGDEGVDALKELRPLMDQVATAIGEVSSKTVTSTGRIDDSIIRTSRSFDDLAKQIRDNPKEAAEALPKTAGFVVQLRSEIERARAAGGPVDPKALQQLQKFEGQLRQARGEVGHLKQEINDAVGSIGSLQDLFTKSLGSNAVLIGKAAMALGLVKESYALFRQVADQVGVDQQEVTKHTSEFKSELKETNNAIVNITASSMAFISSFLSGDFEGAKSAIHDYTNEWVRFAAQVSTIYGDKAEAGINAMLAAQVPLLDIAAASTAELAKVAKLRNEYEAAGVQHLKAFNQILLKNSDDLPVAIKALESYATQIKNTKTATTELTTAQKEWNQIAPDIVKAIEEQIDAIRREREERRLGLDIVNAEVTAWQNHKAAMESSRESAHLATMVEGGLSESMHATLNVIKQLLPNWQENTAQLEKMGQALLKDVDAYKDGLTPEQEKALKLVGETIVAYEKKDIVDRGAAKNAIEYALALHNTTHETGKAKDATSDLTLKVIDGKKVIESTGQAAGDSAVHYDEATKSIRNTADAIDTLGKKGGTVSIIGQTARDQVDNIRMYNDELDRMGTVIESALTNGRALVEVLRAIGQAAAAASQGKPDGFTEIPNSNSPQYPGVTEGS